MSLTVVVNFDATQVETGVRQVQGLLQQLVTPLKTELQTSLRGVTESVNAFVEASRDASTVASQVAKSVTTSTTAASQGTNQLRDSLKQLRAEVVGTVTGIAPLEQIGRAIGASFTAATTSSEQLRDGLKQLRAEVQGLVTGLAPLEQTGRVPGASFEAAAASSARLRDGIKGLRSEVQGLVTGLEPLQQTGRGPGASFEEATASAAKFRDGLKGLRSEVQGLVTGLEPLTQTGRAPGTSFDAAAASSTRLRESLKQLRAEVQGLVTGMAPLEDTGRAVGASLDAATASSARMRDGLKGLRAEVAGLTTGFAPLLETGRAVGASLDAAVAASERMRSGMKGLSAEVIGTVAGFKPLADTGRAVGSTFADAVASSERMRSGLKGLSSEVIAGTKSFDILHDGVLKTGRIVTGFEGDITKMGAEVAKTPSLFARAMTSVIAYGASYLTLRAAVEAVKDLFLTGIGLDAIRQQFIGVTQSVQQGTVQFEFVQALSAQLGVSLVNTAEAFGRLNAATLGTVLQGQATRDVFQAVSSAARVLQLSNDQTQRTFLALQEMAGKGVIAMEELRRQLGQALPGALQATARALPEAQGSLSRLFGLVESGTITATRLFPAMTKGLNDTFGPALANALTSTQVALDRVTSSWQNLADALAQSGALEVLRVFLIGTASSMDALADATRDATAELKSFFGLRPSESRQMANELQSRREELEKLGETIDRLLKMKPEGVWIDRFLQSLFGGTDPGTKLSEVTQVFDQLKASYLDLLDQFNKSTVPTGPDPLAEIATRARESIDALGRTGSALNFTKLTGQIDSISESLAILNRTAKEVDPNTLRKTLEMDPAKAEALRKSLIEQALPREKDIEAGAARLRRQLEDQLKAAQIKLETPFAEADIERQNRVLVAQAQAQVQVTQSVQQKRLALWQADREAAEAAFEEEEQLALSQVTTEIERQRVILNFQARRIELTKTNALEEIRINRERVQAVAQAEEALLAVRISTEKARAATQAPEEARSTLAGVKVLESQLVVLRTQTNAELAKLDAARLMAESKAQQDTTKLYATEEQNRIKLRQQRMDLESKLALTTLQGQQSVLEAQRELQEANLEQELILTEGNVFAQMDIRLKGYEADAQAQARLFENRRQQLENQEATEIEQARRRIEDEEVLNATKLEIHEKYLLQRQALDVQQAASLRQLQNKALEEWRQWVTTVQSALGNFLVDWASGEVDSIKDVFDDLKRYFFRIIADMIAYAATNQIVVPIVSSIVGGLGGGALGQAIGGAGAATGGTGLGNMLGLGAIGNQLFGSTSVIGNAFSFLTDSVNTAANSLADLAGSTAFPAGFVGPLPEGAAQVSGFGALGGAVGLGVNVMGAINAPNMASRVGSSVGAAGAAVALAASLGLIASGVAAPIGLAVAALAPLIGSMVGDMIKERGPRLVADQLSGLEVGLAEGILRVSGDLTTGVLRAERTTVNVQGIADDVERNVTGMVTRMVDVMNAIALAPEEILEPTQVALKNALDQAISINSSSSKNMQADLQAQMRFITVQIGSFFLDPLNQAVEQLQSADLQTQIQRFAPTMAGASQVFRMLNDEINELSKVANTDVLRQISSVRNRIENFANQLVEASGQLAASIVDGVVEAGAQATQEVMRQSLEVQALSVGRAFGQRMQAATSLRVGAEALGAVGLDFSGIQQELERLFTSVIVDAFQVINQALARGPFDEALNVILAIPDAVVQLNPVLAQMKVLAQAFAPIVNNIATAIDDITSSMQTLPQRVEIGRARILELGEAIQDAGTDVGVALPLYDRLRQQIVDSANLQIQAIEEIAQAWDSAMSSIESSISSLEDSLGLLDRQFANATTTMTEAQTRLQSALDAGDVLEAVRAVEAYGQAIMATAEIQIQMIEQQREATIASFQREVDAAQAAVDAHQSYIDALQNEVDLAQQYIDGLEQQADLTQQYIDTLEEQASVQQDYIQSLQEQARAQEDVVQGLQQQVEQLREMQERIQGIIRSAVSPTQAAGSLRQAIAEAMAAQGGLTGAEAIANLDRLVALNEELKRLGEQSNQLSLVQEAINNLSALEALAGVTEAGATAQLSVAEQQLAATQATLTAAEQTLGGINAQITIAQQQLGGINAQIDLAQQNLDAIQAQVAIAEQQMKALQAVVTIAQAQLDAVQASTYWDEQIAAIQQQALGQLMQLRDLLIQLQGPTPWEDQVLAVQRQTVAELQAMQGALAQLFNQAVWGNALAGAQTNYQAAMTNLLNTISTYNLALPLKVTVGNFYDAPRQRGGLVGLPSGLHYAHGGMVPVLAEPGELVFPGPLSHAQSGALLAINQAFPRFGSGFMVPGSGSGDHVPLMLPPGSGLINRVGSRAMGFQQGGTVSQGNTGEAPVYNYYFPNLTLQKGVTLEELRAMLREVERRRPTRGG